MIVFFQWFRFVIAALLMLAGLSTLFATIVGLFRFHSTLNRIHVAAKCYTFGVLMTFSSLIVILGWDIASVKIILIIIFLWLANPVSGHLISYLEVATNPKITEECEVLRYDDGN